MRIMVYINIYGLAVCLAVYLKELKKERIATLKSLAHEPHLFKFCVTKGQVVNHEILQNHREYLLYYKFSSFAKSITHG